jgi:transcription initiation factor TFIIIB Brf1 subunit/transcription initiation factor TFIIB
MMHRWRLEIERSIPAIDLIDLAAEHGVYYSQKRQFAPEYSQQCYLTMLEREFAIGDFIDWQEGELRVSNQARRHMVTLIEDLNRLKNYKEESLYLAASLADRFLVNLAVKNEAPPCLIKLAVITTLVAAKLEEPIQPSYNRMVRLVASEWGVVVTKKELVDLEEEMIRLLDFDLHFTGPIPFLERFQRIYNLDQVRRDREAYALDFLARNFCRAMLRSQSYLTLKPSQVAAAALMLAINLSSSDLAPRIGM